MSSKTVGTATTDDLRAAMCPGDRWRYLALSAALTALVTLSGLTAEHALQGAQARAPAITAGQGFTSPGFFRSNSPDLGVRAWVDRK